MGFLAVVDLLTRHSEFAAGVIEAGEEFGVQIPLDPVEEAGEVVAVKEAVARPERSRAHHIPQPGEQLVPDRLFKPPVLRGQQVHPRLVVAVGGVPALLPASARVLLQPVQDSGGAPEVLGGLAAPIVTGPVRQRGQHLQHFGGRQSVDR